MEELAVRWKMKDPGRADDTTEYSSVPLMSSQADDLDDQVIDTKYQTSCRTMPILVCSLV